MRRPGGAESGRGRRGAGGGWRRALTLIELVVALVIALGLAAVVLPAAAGRLRAAGLGEVASRVEAAVVLACAEAQRRGEVLELVLVEDGGGEGALYVRAVKEDERDEPAWRPGMEEPLAELPGGVKLWAGEGGTRGDGGEEGAGRVLAVVLPDGTVVREVDPLIFEDAEGRRVEVRIGAWTGRVSVGGRRAEQDEGETLDRTPGATSGEAAEEGGGP